MEYKNFLPKSKERTIRSPWVIEEISNGLKARSVKVLNGIVIKTNKNVAVQYFEYDRIFGRGAFSTILKVMEMFDELKEVTPDTIGYIFKDQIYINYSKGILKRNNKSGEEEFYSEESLRNLSLACYLELVYQDPDHEQENTDRPALLSKSTELETITS